MLWSWLPVPPYQPWLLILASPSWMLRRSPSRHEPTRALSATGRAQYSARVAASDPDGALAMDSDWVNAHISRTADESYEVHPAIIEELLAEASQVLQSAPKLEAAWQGVGPKPVPGARARPRPGRRRERSLRCLHAQAVQRRPACWELLAYDYTGASHPMLADLQRALPGKAAQSEYPNSIERNCQDGDHAHLSPTPSVHMA